MSQVIGQVLREVVGCRNWPVMRVPQFIALRRNEYVLATVLEPDDTGSRLKWHDSQPAPTCACIKHTGHKSNQISAQTYR